MEIFLKNKELHEFAQWFSFHCGREIDEEGFEKHPREDIIDLVDVFIKQKESTNGGDNIGFVKWFAEKYGIYGDCKGRSYQLFSEATNWDITKYIAKTSQEWIDQHFDGTNVTNGLLYHYFQDKIKGDVFRRHCFEDLKKQLDSGGIKISEYKD